MCIFEDGICFVVLPGGLLYRDRECMEDFRGDMGKELRVRFGDLRIRCIDARPGEKAQHSNTGMPERIVNVWCNSIHGQKRA